MADINRKIDEILENKLKNADVPRTSADFTSLVMKQVEIDHKVMVEEARKDKAAKYIVWGFIISIFSLLVLLVYTSGTADKYETESTAVRIAPDIETSTNIVENVSIFFQSIADNVLSFLGVSITAKAVFYIFGSILLILLFVVGDKLILRSKLKSNQI